ncbi:hypothetical protein NDU88_001859 [Pleurodeles waltl]|uniref:Uncharacterized protein n=1 Tax=Pleurodeles waltl TaxID=8319 RepID=A0AAV7Q570_PLEWA|nr:hypothetical protein NDU88_001859 [Pleurodeles waltl]
MRCLVQNCRRGIRRGHWRHWRLGGFWFAHSDFCYLGIPQRAPPERLPGRYAVSGVCRTSVGDQSQVEPHQNRRACPSARAHSPTRLGGASCRCWPPKAKDVNDAYPPGYANASLQYINSAMQRH